MQIRPATVGDAPAIAAIVVECDATFSPPGWQPQPYEAELEHAHAAFATPGHWIAVAEVGGEIAGYVAFVVATRTRIASDEPGLAHLGRLFVRPARWGTGVATALHSAAVDAAADQGFTQMRLFTPTVNVRARRFYEREGWRVVRAFSDAKYDFEFTEYRRELERRR